MLMTRGWAALRGHLQVRLQATTRPVKRAPTHRDSVPGAESACLLVLDYTPKLPMKPLRQVGFFRELSCGEPDGPSLAASVSATPHREEDKIVAYLEHGVVFVVSPCIIRGIVSPDAPLIGGLATL